MDELEIDQLIRADWIARTLVDDGAVERAIQYAAHVGTLDLARAMWQRYQRAIGDRCACGGPEDNHSLLFEERVPEQVREAIGREPWDRWWDVFGHLECDHVSQKEEEAA